MSASASSPDHSLVAAVRRWFGETPDAPCLSCDETTRTWREFGERAARAAQGLLAAGVRKGTRVSFLDRNGPEYFELLVGCMMAGGIVASVNWRLAPREMVQVLELSGAEVILVGEDFVETLGQIRDRTSLRKVVVLGEVADAALRPGDERYEDWLARHRAVDPMVAVTEDDPALMMYTSGTTGMPKGVVFSNRAFGSTLRTADVVGARPDARILVAMPVFHSTGTSLGYLALGTGAHLVVARDGKPDHLFRVLERWAITATMLVPAVLRTMVELPGRDRFDLAALQTICYAGSPISPGLLARTLETFGCRLTQFYGSTETQSATALLPEDHLDADRPWLLESAGTPLAISRVRVVGPDGSALPDGEVGEVEVWSETGMTSYWEDPAATAAVRRPDGFIRTGDAGYLRDGYLFLRDRIKDMVVTGGENVYPVEVEKALLEHPDVVDVAVIGVPSARWGEEVLALVASSGPPPDPDDLIRFCRERLAGYKCPKAITFVEELPRNPSGKVLKHVLREPYWRDHARRIG